MLTAVSQAAYLVLLVLFVPIPYATDRKIAVRPWITYSLIAVNSLLYFCWILPAGARGHQGDIFAIWGLIPQVPGLIPLVTSLFLHVSATHLIWNMAFLWVFGPSCEDALGHIVYLVFYLAGGIVAGMLHTAIVLLFAQNSAVAFAPLVGASGAISALVGMYSLRFYRSKLRLVWVCAKFMQLRTAHFEVPAVIGLAIWFLQNLFGALSVLFQPDRNGIAYWAHIGGFVFGMAVAEITGMLGEGMREYLYADAMTAQKLGEDGIQTAVERFRQLLLKNPDDDAVRQALEAIGGEPDLAGGSAVHQALNEAYATLIMHGYAQGDRSTAEHWRVQFDHHHGEAVVDMPVLFSLAEAAIGAGETSFAEHLYQSVVERFPNTPEALHSDLQLVTLWLESSSRLEQRQSEMIRKLRPAVRS